MGGRIAEKDSVFFLAVELRIALIFQFVGYVKLDMNSTHKLVDLKINTFIFHLESVVEDWKKTCISNEN